MQFTETDMDTLYQDLQQEEESKGYYLNAKGKLMIALYALVVSCRSWRLLSTQRAYCPHSI